MLLIFLILILILIQINCQNLEKSRSVWVEQGLIRGKIYKMGEKFMQIFRGIPYAEPPIGELRFKRPIKRSRWHQEYSAIDFGPPCLQFMDFHLNDRYSKDNMQYQSEDCLYLNVFSPYEPDDEGKLYPMLIWIHGGSFLAGSSDTGIDMDVVAKNFIFNGVVLVTLNYRLGPLGFLNYQYDGNIEGNFGIWDQVMALEWIQSNIKQLNGDPSKITLMGESAGAAAVSLLAVSPVTKGLFHQIIALSGSVTAGWAIHRHGKSDWSAGNLVAYLRCEKEFSDNHIKEIASKEKEAMDLKNMDCNSQDGVPECIKNGIGLEAPELMDCLRKEANFSSSIFRRALAHELGVSKMVVDNKLVPASGVELIIANGRMPIMIGVAKSEWSHKKAQFYNFHHFGNVTMEECIDNIRKIIDKHFHAGTSHRLPDSTLELITNASYFRYIDSPDGDWSLPRIVSALQELEADIEFVSPAQKEIEAYALKGLPVYAYSFEYMPRSPLIEEETRSFALFGQQNVKVMRREMQMHGREGRKAFHGLDHAFIFTRGYASNMQITPFTKKDAQMSKMLSTMITNFVKYGNPTANPWNGFNWPLYTNESSTYAILDLPPRKKMGSLHWPATKFWNKEVVLLEKCAFNSNGVSKTEDYELTSEERLQLSAYRRAWWALWLLVAVIALIIWLSVICIVVTRCQSPRAKPYNNIIVNR